MAFKRQDLAHSHGRGDSGVAEPVDSGADAILEWRVLHEEEAQFAGAGWPALDTWPVVSYPSRTLSAASTVRRRWSRLGMLLLLVVVAALVGVWRVGERGVQALEREVQLAVAAEPWLARQPQPYGRLTGLTSSPDANLPIPTAAAQAIRFQGDLAIVQVATTQHEAQGTTSVFRQEQVYQATSQGWVRVPSSSVDWGPWQSLETATFYFYFVEQDRPAVTELLQHDPNVDEIHVQLRTDYGLPRLRDKVRVYVFRRVDGVPVIRDCFGQADRLCVASPVLSPIPAGIGDGEALQLAVLNVLLHALSREREETTSLPFGYAWAYAGSALHNVQMRRYNPHLADLHAELTQWIYAWATSEDGLADVSSMREERGQICRQYNAHMALAGYLASIHGCTVPVSNVMMSLRHPDAFHHLDAMCLAQFDTASVTDIWFSIQAFETVIEYAVSAYGPETLPALVDGFCRYDSWGELIPAVFGVCQDEFEAGWQRYLVEEYAPNPG